MEENKIQEAEVKSVKSDNAPEDAAEEAAEKKEEGAIEASMEASAETSAENIKPKRKNDFYVELVLFLVLGFLIGVAMKTEAVKRITIGFDDYKMKIFSGGYDLNKLQVEQAAKMAEEEQKQQDSQNSGSTDQSVEAEGGNCSAQ